LDNYKKISKEDLKKAANKYFSKDNRLVVYYLPKSEEKPSNKETLKKEKPKSVTVPAKKTAETKKH
jgi:hypothetical protein